MSLDQATMAALLATFFDESFEGLDRAEANLLQLEHSASPEVIGDLFRAIHSIKGGAGAFGVDEITGLAHVMENLLDDVRSGLAPTPDIATCLLVGVDFLRKALDARRGGRPVDPVVHAPVIAQIVEVREHAKGAPAVAAPVAIQAAAPTPTAPWTVSFAPHRGIMRSGNDPLRIMRQLVELGATEIVADVSKVPAIDQLDPTEMFIAWTMKLPATVARPDIDDVFAWVEDDCDLSIKQVAEAPKLAIVDAPKPVVEKPAEKAAPAPQVQHAESTASSASLRVSVDKVDLLMNMVGELVITQSMLGELDGDGPLDGDRVARIREGLSLLARTTRALQESVVRLRSTPVGQVFARLPRLVHDTARRLDKDVAIQISGQTTELDRTVLEKLGDPLVHIVRNSIDHGIELPADREALGKPRQGVIKIHAEHRGSAVVIEITDDGRGLDYARILEKAKENGVIAPDAQLRDDEIALLIFAPGFSTAKVVSEVSGRGVGMDVVYRSIKELRGEVKLESIPGQGTKTTLSLPLTLAIIDGQLLRLADQTYVIPLLAIRETVELAPAARRKLGGSEVFRLRDQIVPVIDLAAVLGVRPHGANDSRLLMIVEAEGSPLGLLVDELLAQQQIVIKSLETNFGRVDGLAGATILGDGRVAYILDIVALAREMRRTSTPTRESYAS
ncbi:MAG: chemotaxis protein CheA [Kofleriaceae bacterium]